MSLFNHTNRFKKLILIVVFMMLFSFCCPKQVKAFDFLGNVSEFVFWIERGVLKFANNLFCDDNHKFYYDTGNGEDTTVYLTPETIIKGKFALLDANIFQDLNGTDHNDNDPEADKYYDVSGNDAEDGSLINGKKELRRTISGWYYALRNLAIVALLSILVYVGIRMMMTSVSQDKAKYKMMFKDWAVSLCLLFFMHFIMIAILNVSTLVVDAIGTEGQNANLTEKSMKIIQKINDTSKKGEDNENHGIYLNPDTGEEQSEENGGELHTIGDAYAQELMLFAIIIYTVIFTVKYLFREMTIIFLVLLAPVTCITYAIDKIGDGKAQAFNFWFQEFLYNVIIQPFHLLIYVVLVGSATTLASTNVLYGIMCFAVMIPAEKLIKQMFGFRDKLGSPLGAFAGGALTSQLMNAMKGGGKSSNSNKVEGKSEADNGFKENKLKPGLPGESEGSGESVTYDNENSEDSSINTLDEGNEDNGAGFADQEAYENASQNQVSDENTLDAGAGDNSESNSEEEEGNEETENQEEEANSKGIYKNNPSRVGNAFNAMREHRDKKLMAKYGTKNRGLLYKDANGKLKAGAFGKYAGKKALSMGRKTIKGATTLGGALGLSLVGSMFGQGKAGLAAGAALGTKTGDGINNSISKTASTAGEYGREAIYATKSEEQRRKERMQKAMQDPNQLEKASRSFAKRNNGKIANTEELNKELADRARFKETGLNDDQIDDAMQVYDGNIEELGEDGAFQMAVAAAQTASRYSAKDFEDPKKTQQMYDSLMRRYASMGVNQDLADENARAIISNAASTYGIKSPALSTPSRKDAYKADAENIAKAKASYRSRHNNQGPNKQQLDQELEMGFDLRKAGISEENREEFFNNYLSNQEAINEARASLGADATEEDVNNELERRFEIKIKANIDSERELTGQMNAAKDFIKATEDIQRPSNGKVYSEVKQRVTVKDSYHISSDSVAEVNSRITEVRKSEAKFFKDSADKEGAKRVIDLQRQESSRGNPNDSRKMMTKTDYQRKFLTKYSAREMKDDKIMEMAKKQISKSIKKQQGSMSKKEADRFADEIISKGKDICGIKQ